MIRRDDTTWAVTVRYKLAGAARAGTDYKPLSGTVASRAGAAAVKVKLLPAADGSYRLGTPATDKLKITDND